jgi:phage shock protein PspC (stress-responsive transcriptional regulator)
MEPAMRDRLYRSRSDRMLFGVAGGMARYLDIDPSIVRIIWALLVLAGGAGLLLYIVAAIVIPEEPAGWTAPPAGSPSQPASPGGPPEGTGTPTPTGSDASGRPWGYRAGLDRRDQGGGAVIFGLILIVLGGWFLLRRFMPEIDPDVVWPIVLLVLGGALLIGAMRSRS